MTAAPAGPSPSGPSGASLYDVDPDAVAALVQGCPAVVGLSGGPVDTAATYLPGRRVVGVRISPEVVTVHLVASFGPTMAEVAGQVRTALAGQVGQRRVDVVVEDLADPDPPPPARAGATDPYPAEGADRWT